MVENLVDNFNDDKIGLIVFAGDAFVQLPITSDYVSAKMFLGNIDPSMMDVQGTDVAAAINMAANSFTQQDGVGKAIIIITDGENHEGGAVEAAAAAKKKGMNVFVLGVGSTKGAPIPVPGTNDYMTDNTGNTVVSVLNEDMCREIAAAGGGAYIHVDNNSNAQKQLRAELDKLSKKEIESNIYSDYDEQFQAFGIIILLLLVLEICVLERKNPLLKNITLFGGGRKTMLLVSALMFSAVAGAQTDRQHIRSEINSLIPANMLRQRLNTGRHWTRIRRTRRQSTILVTHFLLKARIPLLSHSLRRQQNSKQVLFASLRHTTIWVLCVRKRDFIRKL